MRLNGLSWISSTGGSPAFSPAPRCTSWRASQTTHTGVFQYLHLPHGKSWQTFFPLVSFSRIEGKSYNLQVFLSAQVNPFSAWSNRHFGASGNALGTMLNPEIKAEQPFTEELMLHQHFPAVCTRLALVLHVAGIFPTAGTEKWKFSINQAWAQPEINMNTSIGGILFSWKSREICHELQVSHNATPVTQLTSLSPADIFRSFMKEPIWGGRERAILYANSVSAFFLFAIDRSIRSSNENNSY